MRPDDAVNRTLVDRSRRWIQAPGVPRFPATATRTTCSRYGPIHPLHARAIAMTRSSAAIRFEATLLRPLHPGDDDSWAFVVLPKAASDKLPRRGRTTVSGTLDGQPFQTTLEPDGQLSHWLKVDKQLRDAAHAKAGDVVTLEIEPMEPEPEPKVPRDLAEALAASTQARSAWKGTTTIARVDWIHWIDSAKQRKTRERRIHNACEMLASGKDRVCCFDPSGFYSKGLRAPKSA